MSRRTATIDRRIIADAIGDNRLLSLRYHDTLRLVRPHILGHVGKGDLALSAWQVSGTGEGWRLFRLADIEALTVADKRFHSPAPGYNARDPAFSRILARL